MQLWNWTRYIRWSTQKPERWAPKIFATASLMKAQHLCSFFPVWLSERMSMLPVTFDRLRNTLQRLCPIKEIFHDHGLIFQRLVILKEAFDFAHAMNRQF